MPFKKIKIKPIGFIKRASPYENVKNKSLISEIVLKKGHSKALDGIENYSHVFIVFWLHRILDSEKTVLKVHPKGQVELPLVGVFATRTPNRPDPIGLTLVELINREKNILSVKGLDAFDGTLVLDIKPYDNLDVVIDLRVPKWLEKIKK